MPGEDKLVYEFAAYFADRFSRRARQEVFRGVFKILDNWDDQDNPLIQKLIHTLLLRVTDLEKEHLSTITNKETSKEQ